MASPGNYQLHTWSFLGWQNELILGIGKASGLSEKEASTVSLFVNYFVNCLFTYWDQLQQGHDLAEGILLGQYG